jgi:hypothetical protein
VLFSAAVVLGGSLDPSLGPNAAGSQMFTLEQIYNRINNGAAATKMTTFTEPSNGPNTGTMHTLDEIYDLVGVRAPVSKTGQTTCYDSSGIVVPCTGTWTGQDGDLKKGVAWPNPRFTDNNNGTVTDNLTGLIWLKNANCMDTVGGIIKIAIPGRLTWSDALTWSNNLAGGYCGLSDGSTAGQWRLPNVKELQSLIVFAYYNPALSNAAGTAKWVEGDPFTGVQLTSAYWSSTTVRDTRSFAWYVYLDSGALLSGGKLGTIYVWAVRGGQ